ncbi:hypothetical protein H9P43_000373 [Blastocladiella emersonii ATCC 22665]|nr:hypothetical protein H9P43_000373 [Blastocladiella emersonii ATCC 22665]
MSLPYAPPSAVVAVAPLVVSPALVVSPSLVPPRAHTPAAPAPTTTTAAPAAPSASEAMPPPRSGRAATRPRATGSGTRGDPDYVLTEEDHRVGLNHSPGTFKPFVCRGCTHRWKARSGFEAHLPNCARPFALRAAGAAGASAAARRSAAKPRKAADGTGARKRAGPTSALARSAMSAGSDDAESSASSASAAPARRTVYCACPSPVAHDAPDASLRRCDACSAWTHSECTPDAAKGATWFCAACATRLAVRRVPDRTPQSVVTVAGTKSNPVLRRESIVTAETPVMPSETRARTPAREIDEGVVLVMPCSTAAHGVKWTGAAAARPSPALPATPVPPKPQPKRIVLAPRDWKPAPKLVPVVPVKVEPPALAAPAPAPQSQTMDMDPVPVPPTSIHLAAPVHLPPPPPPTACADAVSQSLLDDDLDLVSWGGSSQGIASTDYSPPMSPLLPIDDASPPAPADMILASAVLASTALATPNELEDRLRQLLTDPALDTVAPPSPPVILGQRSPHISLGRPATASSPARAAAFGFGFGFGYPSRPFGVLSTPTPPALVRAHTAPSFAGSALPAPPPTPSNNGSGNENAMPARPRIEDLWLPATKRPCIRRAPPAHHTHHHHHHHPAAWTTADQYPSRTPRSGVGSGLRASSSSSSSDFSWAAPSSASATPLASPDLPPAWASHTSFANGSGVPAMSPPPFLGDTDPSWSYSPNPTTSTAAWLPTPAPPVRPGLRRHASAFDFGTPSMGGGIDCGAGAGYLMSPTATPGTAPYSSLSHAALVGAAGAPAMPPVVAEEDASWDASFDRMVSLD